MILKLELSEEFDFEVMVDYTSKRDPLHGDDGNPEEIIIDKIIMLLPGGKKIDVTDMLKSHVDIEDAAREEYKLRSIPL